MLETDLFRRILVATDFSPGADTALQAAIWAASWNHAEVTALHVVSDLATAAAASSFDVRRALRQGNIRGIRNEFQSLFRDRFEKQVALLPHFGIPLRYESVLGNVSRQILRSASAGQFDVVVAGHGQRFHLSHCLLGSTAERLVNRCATSVWIVHPDRVWPVRRLLFVPYLGSLNLHSYRLAVEFAIRAHAELHVCDVTTFSNSAGTAVSRGPSECSVRERMESVGRDCSLESGSIKYHSHFSTDVRDTASLAQSLGVDTIVVETNPPTGIASFWRTDLGTQLFNACQCGILFVRPPCCHTTTRDDVGNDMDQRVSRDGSAVTARFM